ncbi:putative transcription factor C2H2 family [Helianthus annuus]|nr:putative transcription factor C2H2 family [Helianthus annuus]
MDKKFVKNQDSKKVAVAPKGQPSKSNNRKGENPIRVPPTTEPQGSRFPTTSICRNTACKGSCGSTCHIECALHRRKVGVVDRGQGMRLDGSYRCPSCGNTSEILGYWKKQLTVAKECRRVDILCYRIYLSFRILNGILRFQDLQKFVIEAKQILETEVGPLGEVCAKLARFTVSKLSVAGEVQALCNAALQKADEFSATRSSAPGGKEGSVPQMEGTSGAKHAEPDSILKGRDSGKLPQLTWVDVEEQGGLDDISGPELSGLGHMVKHNTSKADGSPSTSNGLHTNIVIVPDVDDEAAPKDIPRDEADLRGNVDENYEYCVVFRKLEREGHITKEFRRKLFTWFTLSSTEHERRMVNAFIRTLGDDPQSLGEQLVDSFGDIVNKKRPRS